MATSRSNINVLLLEDEVTLRELLSTILSSQGFKPYCACSISEARPLIESVTFKVAIVDYNVLDGCGTEIITTLKKKNPSIKVIGISAKDNSHAFYQAGAQVFLQKPFLPSDLVHTVMGLL